MCVQMHVYLYVQARGGYQVSCSISLPFFFEAEPLTETGVGWRPENSKDAPVSTSTGRGWEYYRQEVWPCPTF